PGDRALLVHEAHDAREGPDLRVLPEAEVAWRDAPIARHRRRLDHDQPDPAGGPAAEVDEVPVVRHALARAVLAHRRRGPPAPHRAEEADLRTLTVVRDVRHAPVRPPAGLLGRCRAHAPRLRRRSWSPGAAPSR